MNNELIPIYNLKDFVAMRKAGFLASSILDKLKNFIKSGISTEEINVFCDKIIKNNKAIAAPLKYGEIRNIRPPFPKSICTSVNHVVCHGIPNEKKILQDGDIINVDITVIVDGWYGDSSRMYVAGKIKDKKTQNLLKTTYECLLKGIEIAKPGNYFGDIGNAIQEYAESKNFSIVRDFCGHGIGKQFHTPPSVLHYGKKGGGLKIKPGMIFTIEPMINIGGWEVKTLNDGWTAVTKDKSLSAQFEHTIGITEKGNEIFTLSQNDTSFPINTI